HAIILRWDHAGPGPSKSTMGQSWPHRVRVLGPRPAEAVPWRSGPDAGKGPGGGDGSGRSRGGRLPRRRRPLVGAHDLGAQVLHAGEAVQDADLPEGPGAQPVL